MKHLFQSLIVTNRSSLFSICITFHYFVPDPGQLPFQAQLATKRDGTGWLTGKFETFLESARILGIKGNIARIYYLGSYSGNCRGSQPGITQQSQFTHVFHRLIRVGARDAKQLYARMLDTGTECSRC